MKWTGLFGHYNATTVAAPREGRGLDSYDVARYFHIEHEDAQRFLDATGYANNVRGFNPAYGRCSPLTEGMLDDWVACQLSGRNKKKDKDFIAERMRELSVPKPKVEDFTSYTEVPPGERIRVVDARTPKVERLRQCGTSGAATHHIYEMLLKDYTCPKWLLTDEPVPHGGVPFLDTKAPPPMPRSPITVILDEFAKDDRTLSRFTDPLDPFWVRYFKARQTEECKRILTTIRSSWGAA